MFILRAERVLKKNDKKTFLLVTVKRENIAHYKS